MSSSCVIVLTTFPADADAATLARTIVAERLAACVNLLPPMQSVYRWEGKVEEATERQLIMKTTADGIEKLKARLIELHPYDVPEFLVLAISDGSESYLRWVRQATER